MTSLDTLVHHVCEKTGDIHIPNMQDVYDQILAANNGKYPNVLLHPELNGHANWAEELAWIEDNFGGVDGIPIMLGVFGTNDIGGVFQLSTDDISAAMAVANVKWVRIFEVVGWYYENRQTFPTDYIAEILAFCDEHNLKVFWSEWTLKDNGFEDVRTYIEGYEDIVTVGFATNSFDLEPEEGFKYLIGLRFEHWGGSVQAWYWNTRHHDLVSGWTYPPGLSDLMNMPIAWMITHANTCKYLGGELIQFEPYWYFFNKTDGKARDSLKTLHYYLNSSMAQMETNTIILQTLKGEWCSGPAKDDVVFLEGRAETGWDIQPSTFDFMKMPKKYAVTCYNIGSLNPSQRLWLKVPK